MALTRKALKTMGLTEEQVDSIVEMHTETVDGLKADIARYKGDAEKLPGVQRELDELKAEKDDGYKEKYEAEHKALEDLKAEHAKKETRAAKEKAYRELLKAAGISEKRLETVLKVSDIDSLEMDGDKLKNAEELSNNIKTEWADFVVQTETGGAATGNPPANDSGKALGEMSMEEYIAARTKKG